MGLKTMCINARRQAGRAWTLLEMMVAVSVFSISGAALASVYLFSIRSLAAVSNYAILDKANREATDKLTREIREARYVSNYSTNPPSLTVLAGDGVTTVTYAFDPQHSKMVRTASGSSQVLLTNCTLLQFGLFMRPPTTNSTSALIPVDTAVSNWNKIVKGVQLTWKTSIAVSSTANVNSENVQTARIVIRKQQD